MDATTNASRSVHFFEFGNGQGPSGVEDSEETANTGKVDLVLDIDGSEEAEVSNGEGPTPEISEGYDASTGENFKRHKRRKV
ncbi:DEKNAAC103541 [Brettanomyces naardenensis]|uniref:DEKNAAC103541 n=1 Tax=Brettanomyces naardenensis TaxID=13370 RepID=A0A448YNF9_BRENA|nr:DEKNAAC103541 [Brettanomyces naardenensis]